MPTVPVVLQRLDECPRSCMVAVLAIISSPTRVTDVISTTDIQDYLSIYVVKTSALQSDTGVAILADTRRNHQRCRESVSMRHWFFI